MRPIMKNIYIFFSILLSANTLSAQTNMPGYEKYKLKNKMQVVFMDYGSLPVTNVRLYINTGRKNETPGMQDISRLTAEALLLGNEKYTRVQQDSLKYIMGASLTSGSNDSYTSLDMQFLDKDVDMAMDLFSDIVLKPSFPKDEVGEMIHETIAYNTPAKMNANQLAGIFANFCVFGAGNPLGRHFYAAQLNKITADQMHEYYKFNFTPKNCIMVVCGKPDKDKMKALIEKYFGGWEAAFGENNGVSLPEPDISKKEYAFVNRSNGTQSTLTWIKKAPEVGSKDQLAFELANEIFSQMLFKQIREKEGKTYGIGTQFSEDNNNGTYLAATSVRNEVMLGTIQSFDKILKQYYDSGAPQEIFEIAKAQFTANLKRAETPGQIMEIFNPQLYPDFEKRKKYLLGFESIDREQVNKIVKKYFKPDNYKMVVAGNEKDLEPQLSQIPGLVRMPITAIEVDDAK